MNEAANGAVKAQRSTVTANGPGLLEKTHTSLPRGSTGGVRNPPQAGYGPFNRQTQWKQWWLLLWGVVVIGNLATLVVRVFPWWIWIVIAAPTFLSMEIFGTIKERAGYPPLTECIREYVPRWLAFALIYFFAGLGACDWFGFPSRFALAALVGLVGWLTQHFEVRFDEPPAFPDRAAPEKARASLYPETVKYSWYLKKLGHVGLRDSILERKGLSSDDLEPKHTTEDRQDQSGQ
jgi:hypothetical protein